MNWFLLALLGGFVGLDGTSFPQAMFSRPIVAGALAGALMGSPVEGIMIGAILEVFDVAILPIGAARYPEGGPAAVAAAGAYVAATPATAMAPGMLLMAVVFGLVWERVAGASVVLSRRVNGAVLARVVMDRADHVVERRHVAAIGFDFLRAAFVAVTGAAAGYILLTTLGPYWVTGPTLTLSAIVIASAVVLGGALTVFGGWAERRNVFILGVLCGSLAMLFLR